MTIRYVVVCAFAVFVWAVPAVFFVAADSPPEYQGLEDELNMNAERYVRLVLALGVHDPGYVDAYYGPEAWQIDIEANTPSLESIAGEAADLKKGLERLDYRGAEEILQLRLQYLTKQLGALGARVTMLQGKKMTFDEESKALYDAVAPTHPASYFDATIRAIDELLPGDGSVSERLAKFQEEFVIPRERLDPVFNAAIDECRKRTKVHMDLPDDENFRVEYVNDKPWSAYNWYKGNSYSLIQVNTDLPIRISRAIDLACHEGYPGHHVYNAMLEKHLARERGWVEFSVYPLYSPQSLIAEGSANFGIEVTFPGNERIEFEKEVLFPLAGIDPERAEVYYRVEKLVSDLGYAGNEAAREYLDGRIDRAEAEQWLVDHALMTEKRAAQRVRFIDTYRAYVINYNLGQDLVRNYIESRGGTSDNPERRWREFTELLASPRLPSALR